MTKEKLIELGVPEDIVDAVLKAHKDTIDGSYVPKVTFDAEREKVKDLNTQISDRDKQIEDLKKFEGDNEKLRERIETIENENATQKQQYEEKMTSLEQDSILSLQLTPIVNDISDVLPKIDREKLIFKDGKVTGLDEQVAELKKASPHYFKSDKPKGDDKPGWNPFGGSPFEGGDDGENNTEKDFGANLAKSIHGDSSNNDGKDFYFK